MARIERLESLFRREIAEIFQKKIQDPQLGFISITKVKLSKDYSIAKVYYSQLGNEQEKQKTYDRLLKLKGLVKYEVGKVIRIKFVPDIRFEYDDSLEKGVDLVNKINNLKNL